MRGFNVVFVDIPSFEAEHTKFLKHGPELIFTVINQLKLSKKPHVLTRGLGGAVFLQAMSQDESMFGETHMVFDLEFPRGKGVHFEGAKFENSISYDVTQIWVGYTQNNQQSRGVDEYTMSVHGWLKDCQRNLRERSGLEREIHQKPFDELIIIEGLKSNSEDVISESHNAVSFSEKLLASVELLFSRSPSIYQESLERGLITEKSYRLEKMKTEERGSPKNGVLDVNMVDDILFKSSQRKKSMGGKVQKVPRKGYDQLSVSPPFSRQVSAADSEQSTCYGSSGSSRLVDSPRSELCLEGDTLLPGSPVMSPAAQFVDISPHSCKAKSKQRSKSCGTLSHGAATSDMSCIAADNSITAGKSLPGRLKGTMANLFSWSCNRKTVRVGLQA
jgi:hypothetical protein